MNGTLYSIGVIVLLAGIGIAIYFIVKASERQGAVTSTTTTTYIPVHEIVWPWRPPAPPGPQPPYGPLGPGGTQHMLGPGGTQRMLGPGGTQRMLGVETFAPYQY